ncbi:MAG: hypothetical protein GY679_00265 [Mycoplasma sp.]|nr:hypothetical protein [Mycoplasma sp.]
MGITFVFFQLLLIYLKIEYAVKFDFTQTAVVDTFKIFFQFLNITNWDYKPFGIEDNGIVYIILFIGRIFIGYGYYQTIQAFRKYGKN